jgi:hypothetical protein
VTKVKRGRIYNPIYTDEEWALVNQDNKNVMNDFLEEYASKQYQVCNYRDREEIVQNTFFLTLRECREHIEANKHHYTKPHSYAMTAWRSPQVSKLYEILEKTDWENV